MAPRTRRTSPATPRPEAPSDRNLGEAIQQERLRRGGSGVDQAARKAGISPSAWRKIESGKVPNPRAETLIKMATGLGADPNVFLQAAGLPLVQHPGPSPYFPIGALDTEYRLATVERTLAQIGERQTNTEIEVAEIRQLMSELGAAGVSNRGARSESAEGRLDTDPGAAQGRRPRSR